MVNGDWPVAVGSLVTMMVARAVSHAGVRTND